MTRPRTPFWRGLGWVLALDAAAAAITIAIIFGIGTGVVR